VPEVASGGRALARLLACGIATEIVDLVLGDLFGRAQAKVQRGVGMVGVAGQQL
jgi:hypothetical protein